MKKTLTPVLKLAALTTLSWLSPAKADYYQAPYGPGGTWRIYETPRAGLTFKAALAEALASTDPVIHAYPGNLVSVTSIGKNRFLYRSVGKVPGDSWIGLTDREGAAPGAFESQGQPNNRLDGWHWTNGDAHTFENFATGEPNDAGGEDAGQFRGDGLWNDNRSGFSADDPIVPTIIPGSSLDETPSQGTFGFMVEYAVNSPTPIPGIRYGMVFPPCAKLPTALNAAGNWSLREVRGLTLAGNIFDTVDKALGGQGTVFAAQVPYLDFADPDTNPAGGPVLTTTPFPFLSNNYQPPVTDDDNVLSMATTRIHIDAAKAGVYTVRVHGDDGFALRIKGVSWSSIAGGGTDVNRGYIDPLDPTTIVYERGTGDVNTMATINLAAGDYDVEFISWEGGSGAYYEVTATSGDAAMNGNTVQWLPFGSALDLPDINTLNAVRLAGPATVSNANLRDRGNALPAMRYLIDNTNGTTAVKTLLQIGEGDMPNNNGGDNYATKVTGKFTVAADANGNLTPNEQIDVTFRLNCDDGASMRIIGQDFLSVNSGGEAGIDRALIDNGGDMTMTADFPTGNTNVRGLVKLTEGTTYDFVCYMYEYTGGSNFNLFWQLGDQVAGDLTAPVPLSTTLTDAVFITGIPDPAGNPGAVGALVENAPLGFAPPELAAARAILAEAIPQGAVNSANTSIVVLRDGDDICCGRPGNNIYAQAVQFPNGGPDNFVTKVTGQIIVDNQNGTPGETLTLSFGLYSDDGIELHIPGKSFDLVTDFSGDGTATLATVGGDQVISADYAGGNSNAMGRIQLVEGTYTFEVHHFEGGGDSGLEVWWAVGDYTATGFDANAFRPLTTNAGTFIPGNHGIPLIATPDLDGDDDGIPTAWEAANGLSDANAADAALDNDGDGSTNLQEYLAGTNPNDSRSHFELSGIAISGSNILVTVPVLANHYYQLYASTDLQAPWTEAGRALPATNGTVTWTIPASAVPGNRIFFRAEVMPCN
ncbi:MAG TPA: hypothetical protein VHM91_03135 [Verrucomicrobiales bacterium]|nr:hypothetical protein [Verrucomicrobiales bacterium]